MCRSLPVFLDRPPTTASNFFSYSLSLSGFPTKFSLVDPRGLSSLTAHFLILIAALKSRFTNSIRFLPLIVLTNASNPRTFAILSICSSVSGPYFFYILRSPLALFHLDPLKCTAQFMVCIQCSKSIYRYYNKTPCALRIRSRRGIWCTPLLGRPAPCSVRYYEPLTFILLQGTQFTEKKIANARYSPHYRFMRRSNCPPSEIACTDLSARVGSIGSARAPCCALPVHWTRKVISSEHGR